MEVAVRRTLASVTDLLFPVSREIVETQQHRLLRSGHEYITNLPLQMMLYFNAFFSPFWLLSTLVMLAAKFHSLPLLYKIILAAIYVGFSIMEGIRLYLGFIGNLMERVPELAGSWLLTLLLQLPLILLLLFNDNVIILPLERAVHIVEAIFVIFEIVCGYFAIRTMVDYQVTKFHLRQFTDLEQIHHRSL